MKYFDDLVGKNLGVEVFSKLLLYFSFNMMTVALPLGVLVSSIMAFGNLGEHFELTAIKGAGISLIRALRAIFVFVLLLTIGAFFFNNNIVSASNLKAYSLLYDIKHTKPALDIKPGFYYNGIPNYSILVEDKLTDNKTLKGVKIYDHSEKKGNKSLIMADSSIMYTMLNDRYLKLELYDGQTFYEESKKRSKVDYFHRVDFDYMEIVFDLSSFGLDETDPRLFKNHRQMKNIAELTSDVDSMAISLDRSLQRLSKSLQSQSKYHLNQILDDSLSIALDSVLKINSEKIFDRTATLDSSKTLPFLEKLIKADIDIIENEGRKGKYPKQKVQAMTIDTLSFSYLHGFFKKKYNKKNVIDATVQRTRTIKTQIGNTLRRNMGISTNKNKWEVEKYRKFTQSFACIVMFLIGAPLGAIIKKGGLGIPVIVAILFYIGFFVVTVTTEKWAKAGITIPFYSVWVGNLILLPIGVFFLRQARKDARLFDIDAYLIWWDVFWSRLIKKQ